MGLPMSGWIALVGGNEFRKDCEPMDRALLARLGRGAKVVIIPTAAARENPPWRLKMAYAIFNAWEPRPKRR